MTKIELSRRINDLQKEVCDLQKFTKSTFENHKEHILAILASLGLEGKYVKSVQENAYFGDSIKKTLVLNKVKNKKNK